ncbi:MAG: alpha/beta hydrolase, partial [Chloroflexi bacterium]|nr:alpha/beta hydrolase [Chloroflexota bacterium]
CRDRLLSEGVALDQYNSAASAADVNDLRIALGYEQMNLLGVSYGSRLALTIMRDHPAGIRSVLLDSAYPPQVNLYTELAPNADRAFEALFAGCAEDPDCNSRYPNLRGDFYDLADRLNANRTMVSVWDASAGVNRSVRLDGDILIDVLFVGLYNPFVIATMPQMIAQVRDNDYSIMQERLQLYYGSGGARGMQMSVQCREEIPFETAQDALDQAADVPEQIAGFFPLNYPTLLGVCEDWPAGPLDPLEAQPVRSDIPTLILAGRYDPITPPEWGQLAAETLPNSTYLRFSNAGHWVLRAGPCGVNIAAAFFNNPSAPLDSSCVAGVGSPNWR